MMNLDTAYVCWQLVANKRAYTVHRLDEEKNLCIVHPPPRFGRDPRLEDCLMTQDRRLYISGRLKNFLEIFGVPDVEYRRVRVIDGTGLPLDDSYSILHFLNDPDCLDLDACEATRSRILPSKAEKVKRLLFKNDPARPLFQPRHFNKIVLVGWELASIMAKEKFTGFRFMGPFDYGLRGDLPPHPLRHKVDAL